MVSVQVDRGLLAELKEILGAEFPTLIQTFVQDAQRQEVAIQQAVAAKDAQGLRKAAHSLKGASANLGLQGLQDICQRLEDAAVREQLDGLDQALQCLRQEYVQAVAYLETQR